MVKVIHVMADGSTRKDIAGMKVPINKKTETAYQTILTVSKRGGREDGK